MTPHKWSGGNRIRQIDEAWPPSLCRCLKKKQCLHKIVSIIMTKSEMKSGSINHENTMKFRLWNGNSHAMRAKQWWRGVLGLALRHEDCKIEKRCGCVQLRLVDQAGYQHEPWPLLWVNNQGRGWPPLLQNETNRKIQQVREPKPTKSEIKLYILRCFTHTQIVARKSPDQFWSNLCDHHKKGQAEIGRMNWSRNFLN